MWRSARIVVARAGGHVEWANAFASWSPHELTGLATALQSNLEIGFNLAKGWLSPITASSATVAEGRGVVSGPPWHLRATSITDGTKRTVSPVCPHLGGIVTWNCADRTWERPLHGSRVAPDGHCWKALPPVGSPGPGDPIARGSAGAANRR